MLGKENIQFDNNQHEADLQKMKLQIHRHILSKTRSARYFKWGQPPAVEKDIFEKELLWIERAIERYKTIGNLNNVCSQEEQEQMKAEFIERAELWHELRKSGKNFPPEKMERLFALESANESDGMLPYHIKRINKELGIIATEEPPQPKIKSLQEYLHETEMERLKMLMGPEDNQPPKTKGREKFKDEGQFR